MLEKQFRKFMDMAKKSKGNTANSMMQLLESRLDNVLRRLGVGRTIWATRQIVAHGHVVVNGRKTDIASFLVEARRPDHLQGRDPQGPARQHGAERGSQRPELAEWNPAQLTAKVNALPTPEDVPFEVNMNLIIEFYR
jgi:small subunit ribosomal protein S4